MVLLFILQHNFSWFMTPTAQVGRGSRFRTRPVSDIKNKHIPSIVVPADDLTLLSTNLIHFSVLHCSSLLSREQTKTIITNNAWINNYNHMQLWGLITLILTLSSTGVDLYPVAVRAWKNNQIAEIKRTTPNVFLKNNYVHLTMICGVLYDVLKMHLITSLLVARQKH